MLNASSPHPPKAVAPAKHHPGTARKKRDGGHRFAQPWLPLLLLGDNTKCQQGKILQG